MTSEGRRRLPFPYLFAQYLSSGAGGFWKQVVACGPQPGSCAVHALRCPLSQSSLRMDSSWSIIGMSSRIG